MTHGRHGNRRLDVSALARVEGEGGLLVEIQDGSVRDVQLRIFEPPRFFEAFLRGRGYDEPVDVTARICGICPVAYQMSACRALEAACGVTVDGPIDDLRRLLYCGEWIQSHTLHVHLLHAPDFLGFDSVIDMAEGGFRVEVQRGLDLKKAGNALLELLGGRAVHPINVRLGGFHRVPTRAELASFRPRMEEARDRAAEVVAWVAGLDFPDLRYDGELVSLQHPGEYPIHRGALRSTAGLELEADEFTDHVAEHQVPHSTALHARLLARGEYLVGPMARFALNAGALSATAADAARAAGLAADERNPFRLIVIRAVEVLEACEEALRLIDGYEHPDAPAVDVPPRAGAGCGWTEAPRGLLWHRYVIDDAGTLTDVRIVPPTSQNQATIEHDLAHFVEEHLAMDDDELGRRAERLVRNHDPCISCATHFLDVRIDRS